MARIALINPGEVPTNSIEDIVVAANLPQGKVLLIVGDESIEPEYQGLSIPRRFAQGLGNLYGLAAHMREDWDCGVLVSMTSAKQHTEFPTYFAYLLGHEFGHASTALYNVSHAAYEDLIMKYVPRLAVHVRRWDDMPHERRYDQFGMAIAEEIFGRPKVEAEFTELISRGIGGDEVRLRLALSIPPRKDLDGILEELAEFSRPYQETLLQMWEEEREAGRLRVADGISDLASLWG